MDFVMRVITSSAEVGENDRSSQGRETGRAVCGGQCAILLRMEIGLSLKNLARSSGESEEEGMV